MSNEAGVWFLRKVLDRILVKYDHKVFMDRYIMKNHLYKDFSCWFHFRREETREVLSMLARTHEGVEFSNRGLFIPSAYLKPGPGPAGSALFVSRGRRPRRGAAAKPPPSGG